MRRPTGVFKGAKAFPLAVVSRVPLSIGLEYGMTIQDRPQASPNLPLPVPSSNAQKRLIHRFQIASNLRLIRTYGFAPGNPILKADTTNNRLTGTIQNPKPRMTNFGGSPTPGRPVFPRTGARGVMGSPKRFPKSIRVQVNGYRPPVYGGGKQPQTEGDQ